MTPQTRQMSTVVAVVTFSSLVRVWGEFSTIHSLPALVLLSFFFKVEIRKRALVPLFMPRSVYSG